MKRLTREWVDKAEGDFRSCERETRARRYPNYDSACFHARQALAHCRFVRKSVRLGLGFKD